MLSTLVLSTTYKCTIECDFCGLSCNPRRTERMSLSFMQSMIRQYASLGFGRHVTFTGGEPFVLGRDLLSAIECATELGFTSRIVTNGFWGRTPEHAKEVLKRSIAAGLTELNVSVDDFHQAFVPIQNVKNIHDMCVELDMSVLIAHKALKTSKITIPYLESVLQHPLEDIFALQQQNEDDTSPSKPLPRQYLYSTGRCIPVGPNSDKASDEELTCGTPGSCRYRCQEVLKDLVISPTGGVDVCCGVVGTEIPELTFPGLAEKGLRRVLEEADNDLIVNWLALEGPYGIKQYLEEIDASVRFSKTYVGKCHLCYDIFTNPRARQILRSLPSKKIEQVAYRRIAFDATRQNQEVCDRMFRQPI